MINLQSQELVPFQIRLVLLLLEADLQRVLLHPELVRLVFWNGLPRQRHAY